jgi:membrane protein DedA with SNARE-associated domain
LNSSMGVCRKQMSKFLSVFFWRFVLEYWELGKMKIIIIIIIIIVIIIIIIIIFKKKKKKNNLENIDLCMS